MRQTVEDEEIHEFRLHVRRVLRVHIIHEEHTGARQLHAIGSSLPLATTRPVPFPRPIAVAVHMTPCHLE